MNALSAIENNSGFAPFFTDKNKDSIPAWLGINFISIKNSFDCLDSIILTDSVWFYTSKRTEMKITFFQFIIDNLHFFEICRLRKFPGFFIW